MSLRHVVNCSGDPDTDLAEFDAEITPGELEELTRLSPGEETKQEIAAREARRHEALRRLQFVAISDEVVRDLLCVMGVEDE
jgi:hypothetical protein